MIICTFENFRFAMLSFPKIPDPSLYNSGIFQEHSAGCNPAAPSTSSEYCEFNLPSLSVKPFQGGSPAFARSERSLSPLPSPDFAAVAGPPTPAGINFVGRFSFALVGAVAPAFAAPAAEDPLPSGAAALVAAVVLVESSMLLRTSRSLSALACSR